MTEAQRQAFDNLPWEVASWTMFGDDVIVCNPDHPLHTIAPDGTVAVIKFAPLPDSPPLIPARNIWAFPSG